MASYEEIYSLKNNSDLHNKVEVAISSAAYIIFSEASGTPNHDNRIIWAKGALGDPTLKTQEMLWAMLAANKDVAVGAILGSSDVAIQTSVNNVVDLFADGSE